MENSEPRKRHLSTGDGLALGSFVIGIAMTLGQCMSSNRTADLQNQQNFVKIAVDVLSQKAPLDSSGNQLPFPEDQKALRRWSVGLINQNVPQSKIPEDAQEALVSGEATLTRWTTSSGYSDYVEFNNSKTGSYGSGSWNSTESTNKSKK